MFKHYLLVALLNLRRSPVVTVVNVLTLALGLTSFVTAYAVIAFWGSADRQFAKADRIYVLTTSLSVRNLDFSFHDEPHVPSVMAAYVKTEFPGIEAIARATVMDQQFMVSTGEQSLRLKGAAADSEFLRMFNLPFLEGNAEHALDAPGSVVLTKEYATKLFGTADPLGKSLRLANTVDATVTGVIDAIREPSHMGRSISAALKFDLLASYDVAQTVRHLEQPPVSRPPDAPPPPENWFSTPDITYVLLPADGRLTPAALQAGIATFAERHVPAPMRKFADERFGTMAVTDLLSKQPFDAWIFARGDISLGALLWALAALVLAVACINYANLATARAQRRAREVGLRKAVGARAGDVMRQYLLEAGLLAGLSTGVALLGLLAVAPVVRNAVGIDVRLETFPNPVFWVFLCALVAAVTLAAGAYPAFVLSRIRPVTAMRVGRLALGPKFLSTVLVGSQFAIASFLAIVVIVVQAENSHLRSTALGAYRDPLLLIFNRSSLTHVEPKTLRKELERLPEVVSISEIGGPPWQSLGITSLSRSPDEAVQPIPIQAQAVGFDFFKTFDFKLLAGRAFDPAFEADEGKAAPSAADPKRIVVNREFTKEFGFASPAAAVGENVYSGGSGPKGKTPEQIIGVVEDKALIFANAGTTAAFYRFDPRLNFTVVRLRANEVAGALAAIDAVWKRLAPDVAISRRFVDESFEQAYEQYGQISEAISVLAAFALTISIVGLIGMAVLVTGRRLQEIGLRKSLGASSRQMVAMLLKSFAKPVIVANVVAWPLAYFVSRAYLSSFLTPIPLTPWPFLLCLVATLTIAWLAVVSQTLRAARSRPADVLRNE